MLPLGDMWTGVCRANPGQAAEPDASTQQHLCNFGYARGACPHFPLSDGPDAIRFTVSRDDQAGIRLYYVFERDHHPFAHGPLLYSRENGGSLHHQTDENLARQANAYVASYRRRKSEALDR
jgi:hypothetical protein